MNQAEHTETMQKTNLIDINYLFWKYGSHSRAEYIVERALNAVDVRRTAV